MKSLTLGINSFPFNSVFFFFFSFHFWVYVIKEPNKEIQKLLKPSSSGDLAKELFQHPSGEEEATLSGHTASLLHITEKRRKCWEKRPNEKEILENIQIATGKKNALF